MMPIKGLRILTLAVMGGLFTLSAGAQSSTTTSGSSTSSGSTATSGTQKAPPPGTFSKRRENQQDRIAQGVKSGQLTAGETARLEHQQQNINRQVAADRAANGGKLTPAEKQQINKEQNQASKNIYKKKHDQGTHKH